MLILELDDTWLDELSNLVSYYSIGDQELDAEYLASLIEECVPACLDVFAVSIYNHIWQGLPIHSIVLTDKKVYIYGVEFDYDEYLPLEEVGPLKKDDSIALDSAIIDIILRRLL